MYPDAQSEHLPAAAYLHSPSESIDSFDPELHPYGAYLLPYFREMTGGGEAIIPQMWTNFATMDDLTGVNAVLAGGWDQTWAQFLIKNWNQPPVSDSADSYNKWDDLSWGAPPFGGSTNVTVGTYAALFGDLPFLSAQYSHYVFNDQSAHSAVFTNTVAGTGPHATVWGIEKINGQWQTPEDWSNDPEKIWCRDTTSEHMEELVIIFGNRAWQNKTLKVQPGDEPPTLKANASGCLAWVGWAQATITYGGTAVVTSSQVKVRFEPEDPQPNPQYYFDFVLQSIEDAEWTGSGTVGQCPITGQGPLQVAPIGS